MLLTAHFWLKEPKTRKPRLPSCEWRQHGVLWPTNKSGWTPGDGRDRPNKAAIFEVPGCLSKLAVVFGADDIQQASINFATSRRRIAG
jgi:hypothetical protein